MAVEVVVLLALLALLVGGLAALALARGIAATLSHAGHRPAGGLDVAASGLDRQIADVAGQLQRVNDLVNALRRDRAEQHGQLVAGLDQASRATAALADTTHDLRAALANPRARGQWGERMADDVLRLAGFIEGVNYRKQVATAGGTVPDFTFLLPGELVLHMDVKFPVDNYLRCLEAGSKAERGRHRAAFLRDVRQRVNELTHRGYADRLATVGFLLLFIPNESVYAFIHEHDPQLADAALSQGVVLCSPFTLFAVLGVVRRSVDSFRLERTSGEIVEALAGFETQWQRFCDHIDKLGRQLGAVHATFDELAGPRRRQLQRRLDTIGSIRAGPGSGTARAGGPRLRLAEAGAGESGEAPERGPPAPARSPSELPAAPAASTSKVGRREPVLCDDAHLLRE